MTYDMEFITWNLHLEPTYRMTIAKAEELMDSLAKVGNGYDKGTDMRTDNIVLNYEDGSISIYLNEIEDKDMPAVMLVLCTVGDTECNIDEIYHDPGSRHFGIFNKVFDTWFGPYMIAEYTKALLTAKSADVWEAWKEESGFNAFYKEVYTDD